MQGLGDTETIADLRPGQSCHVVPRPLWILDWDFYYTEGQRWVWRPVVNGEFRGFTGT